MKELRLISFVLALFCFTTPMVTWAGSCPEGQKWNDRKGECVKGKKSSSKKTTKVDIKSFNTACRRLGIENFHIHDLRHTFASWLVMEGVPLFEVSKLLRHASIQMTERYAHLAPDYLHDAVASLGFSARFQHTENPRQTAIHQIGLNKVINGRGERI